MPDISSLAAGNIYIPRKKGIRTSRDPDSITGLKFWAQPDSGKTVDGSNRILSWIDPVTGGDYANAAADLTNPTVGAQVNGIDTVQFTAANLQGLTLSDPNKVPFDNTPVAFGAVVFVDSAHAGSVFNVAPINIDGLNKYRIFGVDSTLRVRYWSADNFNFDVTGTPQFATGAWQFIFGQLLTTKDPAANEPQYWSAGQTQSSTSFANNAGVAGPWAAPSNSAHIGFGVTDPGPIDFLHFDGRIAEIFGYNRFLSVSEIVALINYVEVRYGITIIP